MSREVLDADLFTPFFTEYGSLLSQGRQRTLQLRQSGSAPVHLGAAKLSLSLTYGKGGEVMERRHFLKLTFGFVAGATALAASAKAAPLPPISAQQLVMPPRTEAAEPAVVTQDDVDHLKPEQVRWGHHWHRRWHRRHWGWRRHHWRRHHWGRHHWRRHRW
jgi:hypothetical protein